MKTLCTALAVALLVSGSALAAPAAGSGKPLTAQQTLMKTCNATATDQKLTGDARKTFMKDCLAGKTTANATTTLPAAGTTTSATTDTGKNSQQDLMKTCNATATTQGLKGDARKAFMKTCLSKKPDAGAAPVAGALTTTTTTPAPVGNGQYAKDTDAKTHCPTDVVVWVNLDTKIYHFVGTSDYGKTKNGTYMCRKDADAAGDKVAANEKPPAH